MSEDKPAKRRKIPVKVRNCTVMASQTTTNVTASGSKDSPMGSTSSASAGLQPFQTTPSFPNPMSVAPAFGAYGAPTYINRPSNPWQNDFGEKIDMILSKYPKWK